MAMVEPGERFTGAEQPDDLLRAAEGRCLESEQRCFRAERRRFEAERRCEQVEVLLAEARKAGIKMEQILGELKQLAAFLREATAFERSGRSGHNTAQPTSDPEAAPDVKSDVAVPDGSREQMVDALSTAIARLRANVQAVEAAPRMVRAAVPREHSDELHPAQPVSSAQSAALRPAQPAVSRPAPSVAPLPTRPIPAASTAASPLRRSTVHKHSLSWIARWRARRKQRR